MDRIFHHDDTMYEAATKVYVKSDGSSFYAYVEPDFKTKISTDVMEDLFIRGMIVVDSSGTMHKPVWYTKTNGVASVGCIKASAANPPEVSVLVVKSVKPAE